MPCDASADELNLLSCTFQQCCGSGLYHQDCLEKFLKRTGCEKCVIFASVMLAPDPCCPCDSASSAHNPSDTAAPIGTEKLDSSVHEEEVK